MNAMENKRAVFNWQLFLGFVLIVTGGLFLADQILDLNLMRFFWPLLVVLFGITFFIGMVLAGKRGSGLAIPGSIISVTGLLLFIQNTFNLWVTWAYAWALLISATGLGLVIMNIYHKRVGLRRVGGLIIGIGLTLFVLFGVLFEIILNISGTNMQTGIFLGGGLVLLGLFIILSRPLFSKREKRAEKQAEMPEPVVEGVVQEGEPASEPEAAAVEILPGDVSFTGVQFDGLGELSIVQGEDCGLKIEGDPELVERVETQVEGDVLRITMKSDAENWVVLRSIQQKKDIKYFVRLQTLKKLDLDGVGDLSGESFQGETLDIDHAGAGNITLSGLQYSDLKVEMDGLGKLQLEGAVQSQKVTLGGAGRYLADDLQSQEAEVIVSGAGSARVWVEEKLKAAVPGVGSIKYRGSPEVEKSTNDLGSVQPL
jgi:hypothetical protein